MTYYIFTDLETGNELTIVQTDNPDETAVSIATDYGIHLENCLYDALTDEEAQELV